MSNAGADPYQNIYFSALETEDILIPERDLLRVISESLISTQPQRLGVLKDLLQKNVVGSEDEVVAVRTVDAFTFLQDFIQGVMPVDRHSSFNIMHKEPGWLYMSPSYLNPVFERNEYRNLQEVDPFTLKEAVEENNALYGDIGFKSAFVRGIMQHLSPDWNVQMRELIEQIEVGGSGIMLSEHILDEIEQNVDQLLRAKAYDLTGERILSKTFHRFPFQSLKITLRSLPAQLQNQALDLMKHSLFSRKGLVLGFSEGIFTIADEIASHATAHAPNSPTHTTNEIAVKLQSVDLAKIKDVIVAIEPYGSFEYDLMEYFKLL